MPGNRTIIEPDPTRPHHSTVLTYYGAPVPVEWHGEVPLLAAEQIALFFGIHAPAARARFATEFNALERRPQRLNGPPGLTARAVYKLARAHGGIRPHAVGIPRPVRLLGADEPVGGMGEAGWAERHHILLEFLSDARRRGELDRHSPQAFDILTRQLETWEEGRLRTLPQAIAYAISMHPEWRRAAVKWLLPFRHTWLRDYVERESWIRVLARGASKHMDGVATWL